MIKLVQMLLTRLPLRLQIVIIQRHKPDLLGIPKFVRLVQIPLSGIQLAQLGAVARQVVLDDAIVWKQLGGFIQHHLGLLRGHHLVHPL